MVVWAQNGVQAQCQLPRHWSGRSVSESVPALLWSVCRELGSYIQYNGMTALGSWLIVLQEANDGKDEARVYDLHMLPSSLRTTKQRSGCRRNPQAPNR